MSEQSEAARMKGTGLSARSPMDDIIDILRQRRGMEPDDTSDDADIRTMKPRRAFEECCGWHLGDPQWAGEILRWIKGAGYTVMENKEIDRKDRP